MPADMTIRIDGADRVLAFLAETKGALAEAQVRALNRTAEDVWEATRQQLRQNFTVRAPRFILPPQILPVENRATHKNLRAKVNLGEGGNKQIGDRRRAILEPFEDARPKKTSRIGPVAIPTTYLRPNRSNLIDPKLYPRFLVGQFDSAGNFVGVGRKARVATRTQRRLGTKKGQQVGRYFVMGGEGDRYWGLYERQMTGESSRLRKLWNFRNQIRRPAILNFYDTANRIFEQRWRINYGGALDSVLIKPR